MKKYKYDIKGLDCPVCASKLEKQLNKNKDLKNVSINFATSKITYETENLTTNDINILIKNVEPNTYIVDDKNINVKKEYHLIIFLVALIIGIISTFVKLPLKLNLILQIISYILLLYRCFIKAIKLFISSRIINENLLIVISCVGAFLLGETFEGIMVISLYTIGKLLEERAINKSRKSISNLIDIKEYIVHKLINKKIIDIDVEDVNIDDILVVKKGEKIPVDSVIVKGNTKLDMSSLTGESELVNVKIDDNVLSGSINVSNVINIKAIKKFEDSTVSKILELLDSASESKSKTETFVSKISKIYTPIILLLAILVAIILPVFPNITFSESIYRALTFLVISCPCAIAISVPLSYFVGIGTSSKHGILIKGSNFLDSLRNTTKIVFDKTGTITNGSFEVENICIFDNNYSKTDVINILASGEVLSNHPIAKSILKLSNNIKLKNVKDYKELSGIGITYTLDDMNIKVGNDKICNCEHKNTLHLNINDKHIASITINDGIKTEVVDTIKTIKNMGIETYMFTGDKKTSAQVISKIVGIDHIEYEMLPQDKYKKLKKLKSNDDIVVFVGDGINDALVLKCSDIGVSMGMLGSSIAIESSDIVLMKDDISSIVKAIKISKYTNKIIKQNLIFAISIKLIILMFSIFGLGSMYFAVFADTGVTLLTILNTLRIMKKY